MNSRLRGNNHTKSAFAPPSRTTGGGVAERPVHAAGFASPALTASFEARTEPSAAQVPVVPAGAPQGDFVWLLPRFPTAPFASSMIHLPRATPVALLLLAACARPPAPAPATGMAGLERQVRAIIRRHAGDTAQVSVAFRDLATGDSLLVDAHREMHAASTMKVPVMLELFRRADAGEISLGDSVTVRNQFRSIADGSAYALDLADDSDSTMYARIGQRLTIRELVGLMIARSSNLATNLLIDLADPRRIAQTMASLGAGEMHVLRGVEDGPAFRAGMNNTTSAYALMRVMEAVAGGRAASPSASREMVEILERQEFTEMIPAGVPPGTRTASKTGWITAIAHDAAIVFPPGRPPYVLVVMTHGFASRGAAAPVGREISAAVWRHVTRGRRASLSPSPGR
jgi:beta-lactamase class A